MVVAEDAQFGNPVPLCDRRQQRAGIADLGIEAFARAARQVERHFPVTHQADAGAAAAIDIGIGDDGALGIGRDSLEGAGAPGDKLAAFLGALRH
ncbi:hypothetical protein D3C71_1872150 [compost metagenome]